MLIEERPQVPLLSIIFGYGPMIPLAVAAIAVWLPIGSVRNLVLTLMILYGASILAFLAGVRRGLSFRTAGGPTVTQIATMAGLYSLALAALIVFHFSASVIASGLLFVGYGLLWFLDPLAARRGEAPLFFFPLRLTQMPIAVVSWASVFLNLLWYPR
jgi:hypothetical protein